MKRFLLSATIFVGAASVWGTSPVLAQQLPESPIPGPGPQEERQLLFEQPVEQPQASVQPAPTAFKTPTIHFDSGRADVRPEATAALAEVAIALQADPQATLTVEGHTDSMGSDGANLRLSQARAEAVRDYLVREHGIELNRIETLGLGEGVPLIDNSTEGGRAMNRRVAMTVTDGGTAGEPSQRDEAIAPANEMIALSRPEENFSGGPHEENPPFAQLIS